MPYKLKALLDSAHDVAREHNIEPRLVARNMLHNAGITCTQAADDLINRHMHENYAAVCAARCTRD